MGGDSFDDLVQRSVVEFGLDAERAAELETLVAAADDVPDDVAPLVRTLAEPELALAAWTRWSDLELLGGPLDDLIERLSRDDDGAGGVTWLRARHEAWFARTEHAVALLESARAGGHPLVLIELAAIEADRSDPMAARRLLQEAGVSVDVDLDDVYDPLAADVDFGGEVAEEIAPFAAVRPRPMAGRNEPCPCGSGRKYKQCHLGRERHPLEDRAGWLFVKMLRFMQVNAPNLPEAIAEDIVEAVVDPNLRSMVEESYLTVDLALFEGGVADWFLDAKRSLLPPDEVEMLEQWIASSRRVLEVIRSGGRTMDVIDVATRERMTVIDTVPEQPLDVGWTIIGRLVPVGDGFRAYGGFLPVYEEMFETMQEAFATRRLGTVVLAIGQIFETAATNDELQGLFDEGLDVTDLTALMETLADEASGGDGGDGRDGDGAAD
ncbi:MAG: SEC-C domain-containing protein [Ilumatobacteraceae bacterium]